MIIIKSCQDKDHQQWDDYVLHHPDGTFFHLLGWKKVIEKTFGHQSFYLLAEDDHGIAGVLPLFSIKSLLFGKSLVSIPFAAYGGILADNQEIADGLLARAQELLHAEGLDYLELRNRDQAIADLPTKELYVRFRKELFSDLEANLQAIPRKSRRMIRQGEKCNLRCDLGCEELLAPFYDIFARSYYRLGTPVFPRCYFNNLFDEFRDSLNILLVRNEEGRPVSGVLSFFYKDEVLPYYAGSLAEFRHLAPNDFMYWQLMKFGCDNGYRLFDFGRSKINTGAHDFKRHWGFEPEPLPYQYFLNGRDEIPDLSPANPKYQGKIALWKKLPFWATKIMGPYIVKYIP